MFPTALYFVTPQDFISKLTHQLLLPLSPSGSTEKKLLKHFENLTVHERFEVIRARSLIFRSARFRGLKICSETCENHLVEYATFLVAIDMHRRPSVRLHRKFTEADQYPDFSAAFIKSLKSQKRSTKKKETWLINNMRGAITFMRKENLSWRKISEALLQAPYEFKISHTHLAKVFKGVTL